MTHTPYSRYYRDKAEKLFMARYHDLLVGFCGFNFLFEIKDGSKKPSATKLTPDEVNWHKNWFGNVHVCCNLDEVLKVICI